MIVYSHPDHNLHDPAEPHRFGGELLPPAEVAERAHRILGVLEGDESFEVRHPVEVDRGLLSQVHSVRYLEFLEHAHERWLAATGSPREAEAAAYIRPIAGTPWKDPASVLAQMGQFSNDVDPLLAGTWRAALAAASCAATAAETAIAEGSAYGLSRPPGHHAAPEVYGGYCYLNNTAIAATKLHEEFGRVAVLDIDTHHGNGTQTVFWDNPEVLTISIHGDPDEHFPFFTGYEDETGGSTAVGTNRNLPLQTGATWAAYLPALQTATETIEEFGAVGLVVALGVDTHEAHGVVSLRDEDYPNIGELIASLDRPTVFIQEGGYEPGTLEHAVPAVLKGFLNAG